MSELLCIQRRHTRTTRVAISTITNTTSGRGIEDSPREIPLSSKIIRRGCLVSQPAAKPFFPGRHEIINSKSPKTEKKLDESIEELAEVKTSHIPQCLLAQSLGSLTSIAKDLSIDKQEQRCTVCSLKKRAKTLSSSPQQAANRATHHELLLTLESQIIIQPLESSISLYPKVPRQIYGCFYLCFKG